MSKTAYDCVKIVRGNDRPTSIDLIKGMFTEFVELHGDRRYADDPAIVGGFAKLDGKPVMVIGTQKGRNTKENVFRSHPVKASAGHFWTKMLL